MTCSHDFNVGHQRCAFKLMVIKFKMFNKAACFDLFLNGVNQAKLTYKMISMDIECRIEI